MLFVLLFLGVLSAIWVLGYLSERTAARKLGRLHDEEGVWRGFIQLFLTLCAMTALGVTSSQIRIPFGVAWSRKFPWMPWPA
jgi:hypothetical protein